LNLPEGLDISIAAQGLKRVRFMAKSPDGRIFVTDMYNRADNSRGTIYILDGFDAQSGKFARVIPYLQHLRNPNSVAFYTDPAGQAWLYVPLTDKLERFRFRLGEESPTAQPEVLTTYPDYGLNYKYGGWHLTRTVAFGEKENQGNLYISVGSSCNACEEKEEVRASLTVMSPEGKNAKFLARGLRNAVGLRVVGGTLYATNMGADHLGDDAFSRIPHWQRQKLWIVPKRRSRLPRSLLIALPWVWNISTPRPAKPRCEITFSSRCMVHPRDS
jgi:glucose/arabinose dehydrogenase